MNVEKHSGIVIEKHVTANGFLRKKKWWKKNFGTQKIIEYSTIVNVETRTHTENVQDVCNGI